MLLCEQNTIRSGSWKSRASLFCTIFLLLFLMSAGIASADSDDEDAEIRMMPEKKVLIRIPMMARKMTIMVLMT